MINDVKVGDKVYLYKLEKNNLKVMEGIVTESCYRGYVIKSNDIRIGLIGNRYKFGTITIGMKLWLTVNDIDLAKEIFIKHEQKNISKLQEAINRSNKIIELIKESK